ncbi:uncharacterized protein LOC114168203 [Vigna unguiculata]|uniref:uncharacterized protein LOC114168203 n=1 Tax=Vigna unguiculata TaxID=3917 RepID=UPI001016CBEC|nr:uncharacterized protein LOC114168203 [Vigna unguiculata]
MAGKSRKDKVLEQERVSILGMLLNCESDKKPSFEVQCVDTPIQPNGHDCGVLVLKFIEMWDGVSQFNGKALPNYTTEELQLIRQKFVCDWVLNEDNVLRDEVIQHYDLLLKK